MRRSLRWLENSGNGLRLVAHSHQYAAHVGEALDDTRHGVVGKDLVFQVDVAGITYVDECLKDAAYRHDAITYGNLAVFFCSVGEVLHVDVEESWAGFANRYYDVGSGAHRVTHVDAAADARIHVADCGEDIQGGGEVLIFWSMIVNADPDVVFLYKFFQTGQHLMGGSTHDQRYARSLAVFEFLSDVLILVRCESDRTGCGQRKTCVSILCCAGGYLIGGEHGKMHLFQV